MTPPVPGRAGSPPRTLATLRTGKQALRRAYRSARRVVRRLTAPVVDRAMIVGDLSRLGVVPGQTLLVHSSLSAIGQVPGGADTVIEALLEAVGPGGTLVLPAHSWREMEAGCRRFDVGTTTCCVGAIPERFRTWPGAVRSLHPSHSVTALGPGANALVQGHETCVTPCGAGTPYLKLLEAGAAILLLGTDLRSLTVFHTVEALAQVPYLMRPAPDRFELVDGHGISRTLDVLRHAAGRPRRFAEQEPLLARHGVLRPGRVGQARSCLVAGDRFLTTMTAALRADPRLLLR